MSATPPNRKAIVKTHARTTRPIYEPMKQKFQINQELIGDNRVHKNLNQDIIITTTDKINLALIDQEKYLHSKRDWITPLSILLAVIASLVAADFKTFLTVSADSWKAVFILIGISSIVWLIKCGIRAYKYRNKGSNREFIDRLKKDSEAEADLYDLLNK
ncbi:hypothetical protein P9222_09025 [Paenibacillus amylolyticus]|nr:hypothetical protein [Paenibacillus amylolyticus]WFR64292.1 hypothetical protein P9222_09025 [Paenibacillus amylolyticus]